MRVSVIIPCYNQGAFLSEAIESVLRQTFSINQIEIIVVNDGSQDNTVEIAKAYPVKLINQANLGLPSARNTGIFSSKGEFILPLDADDKIHPTFIEKAMTLIKSDICFGIVFTNRKNFGYIRSTKTFRKFTIQELKKKNRLNYCSLYRRAVWEEVNGYNIQMRKGYEDWDFWLSVAELANWKFELLNETLFYYRRHRSSLRHLAKENHYELLALIRKNHPILFNNE